MLLQYKKVRIVLNAYIKSFPDMPVAQLCAKSMEEWACYFIPKPGKENYNEVKSFWMITLTSSLLKWLERLLLYHFNEDTNSRARHALFRYGFQTGVSTETALHEFLRRKETILAKKRTTLEIFLDIVGAFDNITHIGIIDAFGELEVSPVRVS